VLEPSTIFIYRKTPQHASLVVNACNVKLSGNKWDYRPSLCSRAPNTRHRWASELQSYCFVALRLDIDSHEYFASVNTCLWRRYARKLRIAVLTLVSPEITVTLAMTQWSIADYIVNARNRLSKFDNVRVPHSVYCTASTSPVVGKNGKWTLHHGHFALMGGFVNKQSGETLTPAGVLHLAEMGLGYFLMWRRIKSLGEENMTR
jgi:hypothetical protein